VPALVEKVQIDVAEQEPEGIRVLGLLHRAGPGDAQAIGYALGNPVFENSGLAAGLELGEYAAVGAPQHLDLVGSRKESANDPAFRTVVRPEHGKRIAMIAPRQRRSLGRIELP